MIILQVQRARTETEPQGKNRTRGQKVIKKQPSPPPSPPPPHLCHFCFKSILSLYFHVANIASNLYHLCLWKISNLLWWLNLEFQILRKVTLALFRSDVIHFGPISYGQRADSDDINMATMDPFSCFQRRDIQTWMVSPTWCLSFLPSFPFPATIPGSLQWEGGLPIHIPQSFLLSLPPLTLSFTFTYFCHRLFFNF